MDQGGNSSACAVRVGPSMTVTTASPAPENQAESHMSGGPMRLQENKGKLTLHWTAAAAAAPLRCLSRVYFKRTNFRIVFSVSKPFLTLASTNIWIFKVYSSLPLLLSVWSLTRLVAFCHLCFPFLLFQFRMCVYYHGIIYSAVWSIRVVGNLYWYLLPSACWCVYCNTGVTVIN